MPSQIDPTKPESDPETPQSIRDNFAAAATEITALQGAPSEIDPSKPENNLDIAQTIRNNFAFAKAEIEKLQSGVVDSAAGVGLELTFGTIAQMTAHPPELRAQMSNNAAVRVLGYGSPGDGGGGAFRWSPLSTAAPDTGTVFAPNSGTGRWLRVIEDAISPIWFGAKADGTSNDAPFINKAIEVAGKSRSTGRSYTVNLIGRFRIEESICWDYTLNIRADCDIICGGATQNYNIVRYHTREATPVRVAFDLRGARFGVVTGKIRFLKADGATLDGLGAVGSSLGLFSNPDAATTASPYLFKDLGGSNTTWDAIEIEGFDYGVYAPPEQGVSMPFGLVDFGSPTYQASPRQKDVTHWVSIAYGAGSQTQPADLVIQGTGIYRCVQGGTSVGTLAYQESTKYDEVPGPGGVEWEYWDDGVGILDVPTFAALIPVWISGKSVSAGSLCRNGNRIYRAKAAGTTGSTAPTHLGKTIVEQLPPPWAPDVVLDPVNNANDRYRSRDGKFYRLIEAGPGQTSSAPVQNPNDPQAQIVGADGYVWAYAGPATVPQWQFVRQKTYNSSLTGMVISHFWARNVRAAWTAGQTSGDDSFIGHFRAQGCRGTAITLNIGFLSAGAIFIDASTPGINERYIDSLGDEGSFAVDCGPESKLLCQSLYLQGFWRGGVRLGHNCHIEGWCQPDSGAFRTATGTFLEFAPDVRRATGRITMSYDLQRVGQKNYVEVTSAAALRDGDLMTWGPNNENNARVLSAARNASTDRWIIVYRLLQTLNAPKNTTVKFWRDSNSVGNGTVGDAPLLTLLQLGIIGTTAPVTWETVERNFEIVTHAPTTTLRPYRNIQSDVASDFTSKDRLQSDTASGSDIWAYVDGALSRHRGPAYVAVSRSFPPGTTAAEITDAYFVWTPPDNWGRGPLTFQYCWARDSVTTGTKVAFSLQGGVLGSALGAEVSKTDLAAGVAVPKISPAGPVTVAGSASWNPGMPIVFRVRRRVHEEGGDGVRLETAAQLAGIVLDYTEA